MPNRKNRAKWSYTVLCLDLRQQYVHKMKFTRVLKQTLSQGNEISSFCSKAIQATLQAYQPSRSLLEVVTNNNWFKFSWSSSINYKWPTWSGPELGLGLGLVSPGYLSSLLNKPVICSYQRPGQARTVLTVGQYQWMLRKGPVPVFWKGVTHNPRRKLFNRQSLRPLESPDRGLKFCHWRQKFETVNPLHPCITHILCILWTCTPISTNWAN